jgi:cytoskeletal protein CcmA (bactofilin family)
MAHIEQTRAVVEAQETYDGRIFPAEQAEIDRPVRLRANATVLGSVYGRTVETDPNATVEGSVMAADAVDLDGGHVGGELGTPGKVTATDARVDGTVTGTRVRLTNCIVRGNVVGSEVILEDCVVLGIVTADRALTISDSLCYTVRADGETTVDGLTVVLPQAIMNGAIDLQSPVAVAGLGSIEVASDDDERLPEMDENDVYEQDGARYLTLAPRVLNLEKVTDRLSELEDAVMTAVDDTSDDDGAEMEVEDVLELLEVDPAQVPAVE